MRMREDPQIPWGSTQALPVPLSQRQERAVASRPLLSLKLFSLLGGVFHSIPLLRLDGYAHR